MSHAATQECSSRTDHRPIWDLAAPPTAVYSALGCALTLPSGWRIHRRAEGIVAAPASYDVDGMPPPYEFRTRSAVDGIQHALTECIGAPAAPHQPLRGPRRAIIAHASWSSAHADMNVCAVAEPFDHRRSYAVHIARECTSATISAAAHAVRLWRHAAIELPGEAQHWISEAACLHVTLPRSWTVDVREPRRLVARVHDRLRSRPNLVIVVADGPRRPRTMADMTAACGDRPERWVPMRLGNRPALRRSTALGSSDGDEGWVHQIVPEPIGDAAVFVELVTPGNNDRSFAAVAAVAATRTTPGFRWHER